MDLQQRLLKIRDNKKFQISVTVVILISSLMVGVNTYRFEGNAFSQILAALDLLVTIFFVIEISVRFFAEDQKKAFFKDGWNLFDLIIVISCFIPATSTSVIVLRLLRLARLLRIISFLPELRFVIEALVESIKKSFYVLVLIFIMMYIYGVTGVTFFGNIEGGRFEDLGEAMLTLVQIMTLSSWEEVMLPIMDVYPHAWIYFISFVILSSIIILNLFIAMMVDVVSEKRGEQKNI